MLRSEARLLREFGIRESRVNIERNLGALCLQWLNSTEQDLSNESATNETGGTRIARRPRRRNTIAGNNLFHIDGNVEEAGFDRFDFVQQIQSSQTDQPVAGPSGVNVAATKMQTTICQRI